MIYCIVGTRPEALKTLPVIRELKSRHIAFQVITTGQHTDLIAGTGLKPDIELAVPSANDPLAYVEAAQTALSRVLHGAKPEDVVVVQGDTASALAGARAGNVARIPVAHVEAGLRSHDPTDPWPEEIFRGEIDSLSRWMFCPTEGNRQNLLTETPNGKLTPDKAAFVTGNTIIDQLRYSGVKRTSGEHVLVTLHRRESFGNPLRRILIGLAAAAKNHPETPFCFPVHPNPEVRKTVKEANLPPNVILGGPLPYQDFLTFLSGAKAVLTDSGGVIEEAAWLGVPTVIARNHTERMEAVQCGIAKLVGRKSSDVWEGLDWALSTEGEPQTVFGDGTAAKQIVDVLCPNDTV